MELFSRIPSKVNNPLTNITLVYEAMFSEDEKAVVEQEFQSVIKRLQPVRDAYLDTMNLRAFMQDLKNVPN
jgi:hypothetical protein